MMYFQLVWKKDGVVLECYTNLFSERYKWIPLRKFRLDGDARLYQMSRCHSFSDNDIKILARSYRDDVYYVFNKRWRPALKFN